MQPDQNGAQYRRAPNPTPKLTSTPFSTCAAFTERIIARGYNSGTQCQEVGAAGIGNAEIIAAGFTYALDVWSYLGAGVQVCFDQPGTVIVMDAADSPRQILPLQAYSYEGHTCVDLYRPGTIILQPGPWPPPRERRAAGPQPGWPLSACMAKLEAVLNFRESPGGRIKSQLPRGVKLTAMRRADRWIFVDYHGDRGWVSAYWVSLEGACR